MGYIFGLCIAVGAVILATLHDFRTFHIPNKLSGLVVLGFVLSFGALFMLPPGQHFGPFRPLSEHLVTAGLMFLLTFSLFALRMFGAGDAKLASALALWLGVFQGLPLFILYTSLCGGILGVITILLNRWKPIKNPPSGTWLAMAQAGENRVPYGIAIMGGFLITLVQLGYFDIMSLNALLENWG